ncbi:MAG: chorismate synthase [Planctomycetaceae bacterium]|jgi:chorismate synthase|nr:chorismate synthase [Planctomycetaceae bacterium]
MKYSTAGESHGQGILALVEDFPAGLTIDFDLINAELRRRQGGYGRGGRQKIETDTAEILTGIWRGQSTGAPITLWIKNQDCRIDTAPDITCPRPGHADLAGAVKYGLPIRPVLERASARETAGRVAAGALAKHLLRRQNITVIGFVKSIGTFTLPADDRHFTPEELLQRRNESEFYTVFPEQDCELKKYVDGIAKDGDTVGGVVEVRAFYVPIGLGSHVQWTDKLDGKLARAVMSVQSVKGVEIGLGFESARTLGSAMHDPIGYDAGLEHAPCRGFVRQTNNAGGIEGGMTNGAAVVLRAAVKPIPTLLKPLDSIDLMTKKPMPAVYERSDVCAVPAASVVIENAAAWEIADGLQNETACGGKI